MSIIAEVKTSPTGRELERLLHTPFGLDVWEAKRDRLVVRATEAQIDRITRMGYEVRQIQTVVGHVTAFAAAAAAVEFHSAQDIENGLRSAAQTHPDIAELQEIGRSVENRPIWALRIGERAATPRERYCSPVVTMPGKIGRAH